MKISEIPTSELTRMLRATETVVGRDAVESRVLRRELDRRGSTSCDSLVNLFGLSRVLSISHDWLQNEADAGRIPFLCVGKRNRLYNPDAVRAKLAERAAQGESATEPPRAVLHG